MQMGGARQKHNAEGGREAKKFKNHWSRPSVPPVKPGNGLQHKLAGSFNYLTGCMVDFSSYHLGQGGAFNQNAGHSQEIHIQGVLFPFSL